MNVLITGGTGQLGFDIVAKLKSLNIDTSAPTHNELDITNQVEVAHIFEQYKPTVVIHCAAFTAVDAAEDNQKLCDDININGTKYLAQEAAKCGAKFVYISTDYVFDGQGTGAYKVTDKPNPINYYGRSKLAGETIVQDILSKYFILRISWVFGLNSKNFVKTMIDLGSKYDEIKVVDDQYGSPTYTHDVAELISDMIITNEFGIYHVTNEGICSWCEFAKKIFECANLSCRVQGIPSSEYPTKAVRPFNSRLDKSSLEQHGFKRLPKWEDALQRYLEELEVI